MARRVLVTRPEPGASATASRLRDAGFEPIVMSLSRTQAVRVELSAVSESIGAVAITSANAIRHAPSELIAKFSGKRCFAVGRKTAMAARNAGFSEVIEGPGEAVGLARLVSAELSEGAELAYLTGRVRLPDFEQSLASSGHRLSVIETYDTVFVTDAALPELADGPLDAVLLYSAKAAQAFSALADGNPLLADASCICLSERVAGGLQHVESGRVFVSVEPTEDALLALLAEVCPPAP
ncbi:uroporphyrinogen-III synthase [Mesorhizobium soli]|jgi:uroporphyrinogen-III synthase|uniref:uroporphyrinogen-III synthase n=1 Tax=Pseudaminobacter soli (ex Li et al. 2025) TaxID=1295366 RepID=UPI002472FD9D|nr:uroporphyrinogen-III synthase [Mesorhizobium soli]MDH6231487.1 uroporphyrinogen-III synthase [Mesorhizobium soli]